MKKLLTILAFSFCFILLGANAWGQFNINAGATNYTQDFNTLTSGTWTDNTTVTGWYAKTDATASITTYGANTGSNNTAGLYAFGVAGTNPLTDRALGYITSNAFTGTAGTGKGYIGWRLKNNTSSSIQSLTVTWTGEEWRKENNAASQTLTVDYQTGTTVTNLTSGTWTSVSALTFTSPIVGATTPTALDGNASANRVTNISTTITFGLPLAAGDEVMLRWNDLNDSGNDHAMAIDDVTINVTLAGSTVTIANTGSPAAGNIIQNTNDVVLFGFSLTPSASVDFTAVNITTAGTATTSDLSNFRVFYDADNSGTINGGESSVSGSGITLANPLSFTITGQTSIPAERRYLLVADVSGSATVGHTFTGSIANASDVTTTGTESGTAAGNQQTIALPPGTSAITAGGGSEPATISSLVNTQGAASLNFDFTITDDNGSGGDALSTLISQITITQGTGNDIADWTQAIAGAELSDGTNSQTGTVNTTSLVFSSIANGVGQLGEILDNAAKTFQLKIWLNASMGGSLPTTVDGLNLVFRIQETGIINTGSSLASGQDVSSGASKNAVSVAATQLNYVQGPTNTALSVAMSPAVTVSANDANGNRDLGYVTSVSITSSGTLSVSPSATPVSGLATFSTLIHTAVGTNLTLTASSSGIGGPGVVSSFFDIFTSSSATDYFQSNVATGNWNVASNWESSPDNTTWMISTLVPGASAKLVTIRNGHTITMTADAAATAVTVNNGGILDAGANTLTVSGAFTLDAGATFKQGGTVQSIPGAIQSFAATSTYIFNGTQAGTTNSSYPEFGNLIWEPTASGAGTFQNSTATSPFFNGLVVRGDMTINIQGGTPREVRFSTGSTVTRTHTIDGNMIVQGNSIVVGSNGSNSTGSATISIGGNINISSGTLRGTNDVGDATFNVGGNISNNGTWQQDDGSSTGIFKINLNGSASQDISGTNPISFENLTMNNSSGATLSRAIDVTGVLNLTDGIVTTGSNTLTANGNISGGSGTAYVDGKLARLYSTTGSKPFPIGKGGNYRPITLNYTSVDAPSTVTAEQFETALTGTLPSGITLGPSRSYNVTQTGATTYAYDITLDPTDFTPTGTPVILKEDGGTVAAYTATTPDYTATGLTSFSDFGLGNQSTTYTVTYDGNGNTGGTVPVDGSSPYSSGATVTVLGNTGSLVRTGYTFNNWNTAIDGSGTSYSAGNTFSMPAANVILYAQWIPLSSITLSLSSLSGFTYAVGTGPSSSKLYNLSGANLTPAAGNLTVTGSANYEVSTNNSTFSSSVNVPYTGGTLSSTPIYVRLKAGLSIGSYNGETISNSGGGAAAQNVTCSGTVLKVSTIYLSSENSSIKSIIYPKDSWPLPWSLPNPPYPGPDVNDWGFTSAVDFYIVPEIGSQFGACDIILEWDNTQFSYSSAVNGNIFGGGYFNNSITTSGTITRLTINASLLGVANATTVSGDYIAKVSLNLLKVGYSPVNFYSMDIRYFDGLGGQSSIYTASQKAEVKSYLGDVASSAPSSEATGDGILDISDVNLWTDAYWSGVPGYAGGMTKYKVKYDIGPTTTTSVYGMPTTDLKIQFEDLMIFSISYGLSGNHIYPKTVPVPEEPVKISVGKPLASGNHTLVPIHISGAVQDLRAASLVLSGKFGKFIGAEKGELISSYTTPAVLLSRVDEGNVFVDFSLLGFDVKGIGQEGQLLLLRFEGNTNVKITSADLRNTANNTMLVKLGDDSRGLPTEFGLSQNYPNPFNPTTVISYQIPTVSVVQIDVFTSVGEKIAALVNEVKEPGYYEITWNASSMSSGVYFFRINTGEFSAVKKMLLMK